MLSLEVLETRREILGVNQPNTLSSMHSLAHVYKGRGRKAEAIPLIRTVIDLLTQKIGASHPHTLNSINSLNMLLESEEE